MTTQEQLWLPFDKVVWQLKRFCHAEGLGDTDTKTLLLWLDSFEKHDVNGAPHLNYERVMDLFSNFGAYLESGDPYALVRERGYKTKNLIDAVQFVEDKQYFGKMANAWPGAKDNLWDIWHSRPGIKKVVLSGAIRTAKSATVQFCYGYMSYLFSQMHNPFAEFNLSPASAIVLLVQAPTQEKAHEVIIEPLKNMMDASPYFRANYPRRMDINSKILLPGHIRIEPLTSADTSALGENVNSYTQTESNFMAVVKDSKKLRWSNKDTYHQARELWNKADERIETTFTTDHPMYFGKMFCDSSAENPEDFAHELIQQAETDPSILVLEKTVWDAQPAQRYPKDEPRFLVQVGDAHTISKILGDLPHEEIMKSTPAGKKPDWDTAVMKYALGMGATNPESCISAPMRHKRAFMRDIETALKNFAGKVMEAGGTFIPFKDLITRAQEEHAAFTGGRQLFRFPEVSFAELFGRIEPGEQVDWSELIDFDYIDDLILDPTVPFAMAADLSATEDATGFALTRINGFTLIDEGAVYDPDTGHYEIQENVRQPIIMVDGLLRIVARPGEQIDPMLVAGIGTALKHRLNIKWGATDTAESSRAIRIIWSRHKILSDVLSVDTSILPGLEVKHSVRERRILFPGGKDSVVDREFKKIKKIIKNGKAKLDHPETQGGSKDLFDVISQCTWILRHRSRLYLQQDEGLRERKRKLVSEAPGPDIRQGHLRRSSTGGRLRLNRGMSSGHGRRLRLVS